MAFVPVCLAFMPVGWKLRSGKGRHSLPGNDSWQKGATEPYLDSYATSIPLANAEEPDDKEREKQAKEEHTGEGPPRGEQRCHSNHKQSVQCLKTPPE